MGQYRASTSDPVLGLTVDLMPKYRSPISLFASIAMDAALPNFGIQEMSWAIHYNKGADLGTYLKNPEVLEVKDGFIQVPMTPGLGIEVNEELVRENAKNAKHWSNLVWRGDDGALREW